MICPHCHSERTTFIGVVKKDGFRFIYHECKGCGKIIETVKSIKK